MSVYSLNANGMGHPVKMAHVRTAIKSVNPHVFVLNESKTKDSAAKHLPSDDYEIFEERAVKCEGNSHLYKWGTVLGVRKDLQIVQRLVVSDSNLRGRVVAVDVALQTSDGGTFVHRLFGVYAPWNPGTSDTKDFWPALSKLVLNTATSWTLAGDLNATISSSERLHGGNDAQVFLRNFIAQSNSTDLWSRKHDRSRISDWTCRARTENALGGSIIDRVLSSSAALADSDIFPANGNNTFVPNTDHRAVIAKLVLKASSSSAVFVSHPVVFNAPRIRYPPKSENARHDTFRDICDKEVSASGLYDITVTDDESFLNLYKKLGNVITTSAEMAYGRVKRYQPRQMKPTTPEIQREIGYLRSLGGATRLAKGSIYSPSYAALSVYEKLSRKHAALAVAGSSVTLVDFILAERRATGKKIYRLQAAAILDSARKQETYKISNVLKGGSSRKLLSAKAFVPLPLVVNDPDSGDLLSSPEHVKQATRRYWSKLFQRSEIPASQKPWLTTPSVMKIKQRVEQSPFLWPREIPVTEYRALLRRGNARPAPGPDGWEKWVVKQLSDKTLALVLQLHNYIVSNSRFPGDIKDMWITMFHKRGLRTDLSNWRGLFLSNFIANSPMTLLNSDLISYVAKTRLLPDTQVATQKDVQTRDLISYLSAIKSWSTRCKQPVYALKRDQMKGFDYLSPEGMYDAVRAYGLPLSVIDIDKAAQTNTRCFIRTAHGITTPITISGVAKQGGPLSPLKSTLTTSLGHHYLQDLLSIDPDALRISSQSARKGDPHMSDDHISHLVSMVEATDDSYIFSTSLQSLKTKVLAMERFQYSYGWMTQWKKTYAYVLNVSGALPDTVAFDSITPDKDPMIVSTHLVPLVRDQLEFLNARVDDTSSRHQELKNIIDEFTFPQFSKSTPLTLLRKITNQSLIARCRALLALQPIKQEEAEDLDKRIARKIHNELCFPFIPNGRILTLPVDRRGFGFASLARINASLAVEGISRDLNHHIPAYCAVARITLSDWTCSLNNCTNPLENPRQSSKTLHWRKIPATWCIAIKTMANANNALTLRKTSKDEILSGNVSISHYTSIFNQQCPSHPARIDGNALRSLHAKGLMTLSQIGGWSWSFPESQYIYQSRSINTNGWSAAAKNNLVKTNNMLSAFKLIWMHDGDWSILLNRVLREELATSLIRQLAHVAQLKAAEYPDGLSPSDTQWASDGSMIPAAGTILRKKSVTSSCVGAISCVFRVCGVAANIMHGEVMGLIASTILSASHPSHQQQPVSLHSDHLNAVRLVNDAKNGQNVSLRLRRTNGRSYYRWLLNTLNPTTEISYVKAHTNDKSLPSLLNLVADHYASTAQRHFNLVPIAPIPTFHMDAYTYHHESLGWYEGNIRTLTEQMLEENDAQTIAQGLNMRMLQGVYDPAPPPEYPYIRATSAYSAAVQLYARSGQLPVADTLFRRNKFSSPICRSGCYKDLEDPHHIFVRCRRYSEWRRKAAEEIVTRTKLKLAEAGLDEDASNNIIRAAESLFCDTDKWPLNFSAYYLGFLPPLQPLIPSSTSTLSGLARDRLLHHLAADWHVHCIRLTGRIFGDYQRRMAQLYAIPRS